MTDTTQQFPMLRSAYGGMTKAEKRIADYLFAHPDELVDITIAELAQKAQSSEITVSRFCKKLGFSGLQSLKIALAGARNETADHFLDIQPGDGYDDITAKVFQSIIDGLTDTRRLLDPAACAAAVEALAGAHRIAVYGFGNSATVCRDIETRLLRFGLVVQAYSDGHQQITSAALLGPGDVVLAVSHTGATRDLLASVAMAKRNGATIIALTSHAASELARAADIVLVGMGREVRYCSEAAASRLIHMAIVDVLYTGLALRLPERYQTNLERMRAAIAEKRL